MTLKDAIRSIIFLLLFSLLFLYLNNVFTISDTDENKQVLNGFYEEKEDFLDGVYFGSSAANRFWNGPLAYEEYGMTVYNLSTSSQPNVLTEYLMREVEKTQDPELYVVELRSIIRSAKGIADAHIRRVTDTMKMTSMNRISGINAAVDYARNVAALDDTQRGINDVKDTKLDYYLPIIKYHSRWQEDLKTEDLLLRHKPQETKGFFTSGTKSFKQVPQKEPLQSAAREPLAGETEAVLDKLLDYCDTLDAKTLFVVAPYSVQVENSVGRLNEAIGIIEDRGYRVLNCLNPDIIADIGIDWDKDYYDSKHSNILGSAKYTRYLAGYIEDNYKVKDRRGAPGSKSWDKAYDFYVDFTAEKSKKMKK